MMFSQPSEEPEPIYFLEAIDQFLSQSIRPSDVELTTFLKIVGTLGPIFDEVVGVNEIALTISELFRVAQGYPHVWKLFERIIDISHLPSHLPAPILQNTDHVRGKPTLPSDVLNKYLEQQSSFIDWYIEVYYLPGPSKLYIGFTNSKPARYQKCIKVRSFNASINVSIDSGVDYEVLPGEARKRIRLARGETTSDLFPILPKSHRAFVTINFLLPNSSIPETIRVPIDFRQEIDLEMRVWREGAYLKYQVRLGLGEYKDGGKKEIPDSGPFLEQVYSYLNSLAPGTREGASVRHKLENIGMGLYNDLFTDELKELYEICIKDKVQTWWLVVDTDTSQIPWELIVPKFKNEKGEYQFLCERFQISRWLFGAKVSASREIRLAPLALISHDPGSLEGVSREASALQEQTDLYVRPIIPATHSNVEALFQSEHMQGCFGLHLSGDGQYDKKEVSGYLFKLEDEPLVYSDFNRPDDRVFGQVQPFVFLNFCESSQLRPSLTDLRGWVELFFKQIGANSLVATMWKANDQSASEFSPRFYDLLLRGETIGKAFQEARACIKNRSDATWLCYVLYSDPRATVVQPELSLPGDKGD
jgi:hypothetical protein